MATRRHTFSGCRFLLHSSGLPTGTLRPMKKWLTGDITDGNTFVSASAALTSTPWQMQPRNATKLSVKKKRDKKIATLYRESQKKKKSLLKVH